MKQAVQSYAGEGLSATSCLGCRRVKKRCDKNINGCSTCHKRFVQCEYPTTKRGASCQPYPRVCVDVIKDRRRKSVQNNHGEQFLPIINSHAIDASVMNRIIEGGILDENGIGSGIVDDQLVQDVLKYMVALHENTLPLVIPFIDDLAMVYSMIALYFMGAGLNAEAKVFYLKTREIIMARFDSVLSSFSLVACFAHIAIYLVANDEQDSSRFFMSSVNAYLKHHAEAFSKLLATSIESIRFKFLQQLHDIASNTLLDEELIHSSLKKSLVNINQLVMRTEMIEKSLDRSTLQLLDSGSVSSPDLDQKRRLTYSCAYQTFRVESYKMIPESKSVGELLNDAATSSSVLVGALSRAAWMHIDNLQHSDNKEEALSILRQDYTALSNSHDERYQSVMQQIERVVCTYENNQTANKACDVDQEIDLWGVSNVDLLSTSIKQEEQDTKLIIDDNIITKLLSPCVEEQNFERYFFNEERDDPFMSLLL